MLKRVLPLLGTLLLTVLLSSSALAAEQPAIVNQEQALEAARKLLPKVVTSKQFDAELREDSYLGRQIWSLEKQQEGGRPGYSSWLHIAIDANTGDLLNYNYRTEPTSQALGSNVITKDVARETALKFVARMQPGLISQLRLEDSNPMRNYYGQRNLDLSHSFQWCRVINGIPVQRDGVSVQVDAVTGQVISYTFNWNEDIKLPALDQNILPKQQVADLVADSQGFYPTYIIGQQNAQLVYCLNSGTANYDATTAAPVDYTGKVRSSDDNKVFAEQLTPEVGSGAVNKSQPTEKIDSMKAQEAAENFFAERGFKGKVRRSGSGSSSGPGYRTEYWSYSIENEADPYGRSDISVGIDAYSGRVVNFWNHEEENNKSGKGISYQQAVKVAERFLKDVATDINYIPKQLPQYQAKGTEYNYFFEYAMLINGVPLEGNGISIEVNRYSGEVVRYHYRDIYLNIPLINSVVSTEEAAKAFKDASPLKLSYANVLDDQNISTDKVMLVYQVDNLRGIDATTGQVLTDTGSNQAVSAMLANHWARAPLELLADSGLLPEDFSPDGNVSRREAIRVLMAAVQHHSMDDNGPLQFTDVAPGDSDMETFRRAVQVGMFENGGQLSPEAQLTREQLAVWLVNAMGYQEVAQLPVKMELNFKDKYSISEDHRNHIALAAGFEIFGGDQNGNFNPQQSVTWAELATIVTRVAPKLSAYRY